MKREPITEDVLEREGPPLRLGEVSRLTGFHRDTILAEVHRGQLRGYRVMERRGCPWMFDRDEVRAWWADKRTRLAS